MLKLRIATTITVIITVVTMAATAITTTTIVMAKHYLFIIFPSFM